MTMPPLTDHNSGYAEVRTPRSGWGKLWKWSLIAWTLWVVFESLAMMARVEQASVGVGGLAKVIVANRVSNVMVENFVVWAFGAVILGGLTYATRGQKRWVPLRDLASAKTK